MVTKQDLKRLKPAAQFQNVWYCLVHIQCTKTPAVVTRTAELLDEVGCNEEANHLRGQWI